jgi:hypothetical protein
VPPAIAWLAKTVAAELPRAARWPSGDVERSRLPRALYGGSALRAN